MTHMLSAAIRAAAEDRMTRAFDSRIRDVHLQLCGRILPDERICILNRGHDNGAHEGEQLGITHDPVALARRFHELYEDIAPACGYETRQETRVPWDDLPQDNRFLMIAVCTVILAEMFDD